MPGQDEDLEVGNLIPFKDNNGNEIKTTVTHISDKTLTLDANHSLAGEALTFDIELIESNCCDVSFIFMVFELAVDRAVKQGPLRKHERFPHKEEEWIGAKGSLGRSG